VAAILEKDNHLDFVTEFKNNQLTIVVGSSWPKDEKILVDYINSMTHQVKFIIAPHNIKKSRFKNYKSRL
jgi:3-deoxy-D-manno-octulosonic-acid transferase